MQSRNCKRGAGADAVILSLPVQLSNQRPGARPGYVVKRESVGTCRDDLLLQAAITGAIVASRQGKLSGSHSGFNSRHCVNGRRRADRTPGSPLARNADVNNGPMGT